MRLIACLLLIACVARGEEPPPQQPQANDLRRLEREETGKKLLRELDEMQGAIDAMTEQSYFDCMKVLGSTRFCSCLRDKLPVVATFAMYVDGLLGGLEVLKQYEMGSAEPPKILEMLRNARATCVATAGFK